MEFKYPKYFTEKAPLLKLPLKAEGKEIIVTELSDGQHRPLYDIRIFSGDFVSRSGIIISEHNMKKLLAFFNEYFAEEDEPPEEYKGGFIYDD